jgi:sensor histidine kinase regulating citrate/malate metabolism
VTATDDEVVVRVADDGPGIPELERTAISAGLESPLQHATGLGLWLVQWTVTNSGGSMSIADREGGGAVVELRLPATEPPV